MRVTAIKAQIRNAERVSIYIDGAYSFSLSQSQLLEHKLHSGKELSAQELGALKHASEWGKTLERTMNYIMIRPRSTKEVCDYLWRKKTSPDLTEDIVAYLQARRYLDDAVFAKSWAHSRQLSKPVSKRRLVAELRQKGVASEIVEQVTAQDEYDEDTALKEIIARKRRQARYQDDTKLIEYLARQGFSYDAIKTALQALQKE